MRLRNMELDHRSGDMEFSLYSKDGYALVEVLDQLNCPGITLDQSNNNCPEILWNIRRAWKVWDHLGKILKREGADN